MDRYTLLQQLPPVRDVWEVVKEDQEVPDIIKQIVRAHKANEQYYNSIALYFDADTVPEICDNIYDFLKENVEYREEGMQAQTTAVPQGILSRGYGDCKHYASMAGGILSALQRLTSKRFTWHYCFASYNITQPMPYHVFVIVTYDHKQYWIDPTPGAEGRVPVWVVNKRIKSEMPLYNQVAGVGSGTNPLHHVGQVDTDLGIPDNLVAPIGVLQRYGILSPMGEFNRPRYNWLMLISSPPKKQAILAAAAEVQSVGATVGNWFDDAFKAVQHFAAGMGMQVPRASFLGLVELNAFGYANKLYKALQYEDTKAKLADLWERLGGTFSKLESAINHGHTQPAATAVQSSAGSQPTALPAGTYRDKSGVVRYINTNEAIGSAAIGNPAIAAAAISSAAIIVAAIMPVISKLLDAKHDNVDTGIPLDPSTGQPYGYGATGNSITDLITANPLPVAIGAGLLLYYVYENY